ncbi:hypothetical protein XELAEV_18014800mg [Xenopus laevis]|uniref:Reverse transcriptase domain-containing protein n=1 Tax=Xenopus laevis TaxID=8355 RepID=A0A974DIQ7_XENLA|nr:hypothetical protein XELAEV_18014800mg [Xenopus laevis]
MLYCLPKIHKDASNPPGRPIVSSRGDSLFLYLRYIDDVLIVWDGEKVDLLNMAESLNNLNSTVRFTVTYDKQKIQLLDVEIYREANKLGYKLYRKPTNRNNLLYSTSFHPPSSKKAVPFSQFLCTISNNSDNDVCEMQLQETFNCFAHRGYNQSALNTSLKKAHTHVSKQPDPNKQNRFIVTSRHKTNTV